MQRPCRTVLSAGVALVVGLTLAGCADDRLAYVDACVERQGVDPASIDWDRSTATATSSGGFDVRVVASTGTDVVAECLVTHTGDGYTVSG